MLMFTRIFAKYRCVHGRRGDPSIENNAKLHTANEL